MSFFGGLIDSFTGKSARGDIDKGIGAVQSNTGKAVGAIQQGAAGARGYIQPYVDQGGKAFGLYGDTLGVNGAGARGAAEDLYNSDDMLAKQRAYDLSRAGRAANASGSFNSGAAALADSRVRMQGYGDWQNRLAGMGQQGQSAATTGASIDTGEGNAVAGAYGAGSGALAGLYGQRAQTENTLAQNLLGIGGTVARYFGYGANDLGRRGSSGAGGP